MNATETATQVTKRADEVQPGDWVIESPDHVYGEPSNDTSVIAVKRNERQQIEITLGRRVEYERRDLLRLSPNAVLTVVEPSVKPPSEEAVALPRAREAAASHLGTRVPRYATVWIDRDSLGPKLDAQWRGDGRAYGSRYSVEHRVVRITEELAAALERYETRAALIETVELALDVPRDDRSSATGDESHARAVAEAERELAPALDGVPPAARQHIIDRAANYLYSAQVMAATSERFFKELRRLDDDRETAQRSAELDAIERTLESLSTEDLLDEIRRRIDNVD